MKILVLGASGMLGREIVANLPPKIDFYAPSKKDCDVTQVNQLQKTFAEFPPDVVINASGFTNVEKAEGDPEQAFLVNGYAIKNLAKLCEEHQTILMHFSTDYVFDGESSEYYAEGDTTNPLNCYGASKLLGEQFIQQELDQHYIFRIQWLYSSLGNNFLLKVLNKAKGLTSFEVVEDEFGAPTSVKFLVRILLEFLEKVETQSHFDFGLYHAAPNGEVSRKAFAEFILNVADRLDLKTIMDGSNIIGVSSKDFETGVRRGSRILLSCDKLENTLERKLDFWQENVLAVLEEIERYGAK